MKCPHDNIVHCPLYVASHGVGFNLPQKFAPIYGCSWGALETGCAVVRGDIDYHREIALLCETLDGAGLVAELIASERAEASKQQRLRNMRAAGIQ